MPWSSSTGFGDRKLDDYDDATETGYEGVTPWSSWSAKNAVFEAQRKLKQFADDFALIVEGKVRRIEWFGPEDLPKTGPFAELRAGFESMKREGIPLEYRVIPEP